LRDRAALIDELANHILKVFLALPPSEKFFPYPRTEESGVRDSKLFIGHDFVLSRSYHIIANIPDDQVPG
jgi:hypothetical protein